MTPTTRLVAVTAVSVVAGLVTALTMPRRPVTPLQVITAMVLGVMVLGVMVLGVMVLGVMVLGAAVGGFAGYVLRSR